MHSLTRDISQLMLKNYKTDFRQLMDEMDWEAENGDTAANTAVLNGRLIPFYPTIFPEPMIMVLCVRRSCSLSSMRLNMKTAGRIDLCSCLSG
ncbi:MAG: hypothetical protein ACLR0U_16735 [Enterocloster clostridioformis]